MLPTFEAGARCPAHNEPYTREPNDRPTSSVGTQGRCVSCGHTIQHWETLYYDPREGGKCFHLACRIREDETLRRGESPAAPRQPFVRCYFLAILGLAAVVLTLLARFLLD